MEVGAQSGDGLWNIHNLQIRLVAQIVDFRPEDRHTATNLDKTETLETVDAPRPYRLAILRQRVEHDHLLCLVEIGDVSLRVDTAGEVTRSDAISRPPGDEEEEQVAIVHDSR